MQAMKVFNTADSSREDWLKERMRGIGGSDAAAVAGVSRWKSPVAVWLEKTGQITPEEPGEAAYWGTVLEDIVAEEFAAKTGLKVRNYNFMMQHPEHSFMLANIDRKIVGQKVGLECKTTSAYNRDEWAGDNVPDTYYIQCQHYMAVTGYESWWIACLIGGNKFVYKLIKRNDEFIERLIQIEKDFWQHVVDGTMPAVDGSESSSEALKRLYPESKDMEIILPDTAELWIRQYEAASDDERAAKERKQEAQNVLENMLGECERGRVGERIVSWKSTKPREIFDGKRFQADYPELYKQYIKIGEPYRRFSVK